MVAMASNRTYGLNLEANETMHPQPFSLVGDGAGSTFKVFTVAAAMEMGMGINAQLDVPGAVPGQGARQQRHPGLPGRHMVREERRRLPRVDEHHRRTGHVAEYRLREAHLAGRRAALGGYGGQARPAVLRVARHRPRLRPGKQREPGRLRQAAEHRLLHAGADRGQRAGVLQRGGDTRVRRNVVSAKPDRRGDRPRRQPGLGDDRNLRAGGARGPGQHTGQRVEQGRQRRGHRRVRGRLGRLGPADVGQDRHHRGEPLIGVPRVHQHIGRGRTTSTTTPQHPAGCARSRCASAAPATCSAATSPRARGSPR